MSKRSKKDFKSYVMIFVIGIILTTITILGILQAPIKKLSMEGEVKAYEVVVKHRSIRHNNKTSSGNQPTYYYYVGGKEYEYTLSKLTKASEKTLKNKNTIYYNVNDPNDCVSEYETTLKFTDILGITIMLTLPLAALKGMLSVKNGRN